MSMDGLKMQILSNTPRYCSRIRLIRVTVLPDFDGPRKMPVHGARGTTGSEDCFRHRKQLDLPHSFVSLTKFEAGKPGGKSAPCFFGKALTEFSGRHRNPALATGLRGAILRWPQD